MPPKFPDSLVEQIDGPAWDALRGIVTHLRWTGQPHYQLLKLVERFAVVPARPADDAAPARGGVRRLLSPER